MAASAIEQGLLDKEEFAAVLSADYIARTDPSAFGASIYVGDDVDQGIPSTSLLA